MTAIRRIASTASGEKSSSKDLQRCRTCSGISCTLRVSERIGEGWIVA